MTGDTFFKCPVVHPFVVKSILFLHDGLSCLRIDSLVCYKSSAKIVFVLLMTIWACIAWLVHRVESTITNVEFGYTLHISVFYNHSVKSYTSIQVNRIFV